MMTRFIQASRFLLGLPVSLPVGDGAWTYDPRRGVLRGEDGVWTGTREVINLDIESDFDSTKYSPLDLVFGGVLENVPPVCVLSDGRFRTCVYREPAPRPGEQRSFHWLLLELRGEKEGWHHLITMHESRLGVMRRVLDKADEFLSDAAFEYMPQWVKDGDYQFPGR